MSQKENVLVEDQLDCEGFLSDSEFWNSNVAETLAKKNNIGEFKLSDEHWKVINFVREYYEKYARGPEIVKVAKFTGLNSKEICTLFPCGFVKGAYRLAGLPRPPGCI